MNQRGILDLPIYEFLHLTTFLDGSSKFSLNRTCRYFEKIMNSPLVWKPKDEFNATCLSSKEEVTYLMEKMPKRTRKILFRGKLPYDCYLPFNFFKELCTFNNLTVLALEKVSFNQLTPNLFEKLGCLGMKDFPPTLTELSLKGTNFIVNNHFLFSLEGRPNLKVLILDECHWMNNDQLSALIAYPNLEIISLIGCSPEKPLWLGSLFNVAWNLKIVDVRLANIDDGYLSESLTQTHFVCFPIQSLQCVYFENSAFTNQGTRLLRLCAAMFNQTINFTPPYPSSLYVDPIQECSCGYEKPSKQLSVPIDNIERARMKLSLRNFNCVDLDCISTLNLDVLDLTGSGQCDFSIVEYRRLQPNSRVIHHNICKCLVTTPGLSVDLPKVYKSHHNGERVYETMMDKMYDTLVIIIPWID